jgi:hypothetical protein
MRTEILVGMLLGKYLPESTSWRWEDEINRLQVGDNYMYLDFTFVLLHVVYRLFICFF